MPEPTPDADLDSLAKGLWYSGALKDWPAAEAAAAFVVASPWLAAHNAALLARVRAAEAERDEARLVAGGAYADGLRVGSASTKEATPAHCPSCDGYQSAVMDDGQRSVGVCEGIASRTVETAEEWEYGYEQDGVVLLPGWSRMTIERIIREHDEEDGKPGVMVRRHIAGVWQNVPPTPDESDLSTVRTGPADVSTSGPETNTSEEAALP